MQLTKDNSIIQTLKHLRELFGKDCFKIEDHWTADLCAIGLTDRAGKYLFYLSTYKKEQGTIYFEIEDKINPIKSKVVFENITQDQLQDIFKQYILVEPN